VTLVMPQRTRDRFGWHGHAVLRKFWADDDLTRATPYDVMEAENLLLTVGATLALNLIFGSTGTKLDGTNGRMCVGDSATAAAAGQTDLQAATNKFRKAFDAPPTISGNQVQCVTTFATGEANFTWAEAGLANSASGATMFDRFVQAFGAKSGQQWILTITGTLT